MKDVLITGGAGKIGFNLVLKLLETNANVTILDLESKDSIKKTLKYKDKIKIIYGDVEDTNLVRDLVRRNDIVIDYAGIMPPLADLNEEIANSTNFGGTKNIVDAIKEVNPECVYIYMSFISVYGTSDKKARRLNVDSETTHPDDHYSISLIRSEEYIRSNLEKYTILRMPIVLTRKNYYLKHMMLNRKMDFITADDLNDIVMGIMKSSKIYGKTYNISGFKISTNEVIEKLYRMTGKFFLMKRDLYYGEYEDAKDIEKVVKPDYISFDEFISSIKVSAFKRTILKIINYPKYIIYKHFLLKK